MSVQSPRTAREALLAEVLDEVDSLHRQVLALPDSLVAMEVKLARTVSVLDQAADNFRMAVTAFSEQAKVDLLAFHERKTAQASSRILDEQRRTIQEILQAATLAASSSKSKWSGHNPIRVASISCRSTWATRVENILVTVLTSTGTVLFVTWILRGR